MKNVTIFLISALFCMFFLISCGDAKEQKINELKQQIQIEQQMKEKAQQQIQIEQQMKEKAQQDVEKVKSNFSLLTGISITIGILALVIGVAMGSKARRDANSQSIMNEDKSDG